MYKMQKRGEFRKLSDKMVLGAETRLLLQNDVLPSIVVQYKVRCSLNWVERLRDLHPR